MDQFIIFGSLLSASDENSQRILEKAYNENVRPLCIWSQQPVPMYICFSGGKYLVKRIPNSGKDHAPNCSAYEPPDELSGLSQVIGTAITEDTEKWV